jgi:hypothetical protein
MDRTVDRTVIDRNTVPNLRKPYKIRWCTVITVPYRITVNRTVHRRVTTLIIMFWRLGGQFVVVGGWLVQAQGTPQNSINMFSYYTRIAY